jgi:hypothetical protein
VGNSVIQSVIGFFDMFSKRVMKYLLTPEFMHNLIKEGTFVVLDNYLNIVEGAHIIN